MKKLLLLFLSIIGLSFTSLSQCGTTVMPSVSIMPDINSICNGQAVTFTASAVNGGSSPTFVWKINNLPPIQTSIGIFTTSNLSPSNLVTVDLISNDPCASPATVTSNSVQINVIFGIDAGFIGTDQTICSGTVPAAITQFNMPTGLLGTPIYTWETSASGMSGPFTTIVGETNATYAFSTPLFQDVYIRRVIMDPSIPAPCNTATSNAVKITVTPDVIPGVISGDETICEGKVPTAITSTSLPMGGGGGGTYTYVWESSTTSVSGTFYLIPGATNTIYAPGNLTETTYYRRRETNACKTVHSNVVTKTVTASTAVGVITNNPGQTCAGVPITFTATPIGGGTTPTYEWSKGGTVVGNNSSTYTFTPVFGDNGKQVVVRLTSSNVCNTGTASSSPVTLHIVDAMPVQVSIQTSNNPNCVGLPSTFSIANQTGTGSTPTYKWVVNAVPVGTGGSSFTSTSLVNGDQVWVEMTSSLACIIGPNTISSNKIVMNIKPIPSPVISGGNKTICAGNSFIFHATVGSGTTYQWHRYIAGSNNTINTAIPGATNTSYTATQDGQYTLSEDNGTCNSASAPVSLTIDPCGGFSTSILGPHPIASGQLAAIYKVFKQNGFAYAWSVLGGKIVSGQGTNSITVDWDAFTVDANARITTPVYSVSVTETNTNNIQKTTTLDVRSTATSVSRSLAQSGITLFPNPATESFNIEMPESGVAVSYEILDLTGASVAKGNFVSTSSAEKITTNFGAGMYQVVLRYNDVVTCGRLSKIQ